MNRAAKVTYRLLAQANGIASQYFRPAMKAFRIIVSLLVLVAWIWLSEGWVELSLDYPLRRAGESDLFPALGTPAFYRNCTWVLLTNLVRMVILVGVPLTIASFCLLRNCAIKSRLYIALFLAGISIGPSACFGVLQIQQHMNRMKEYHSKVDHS